MMVSENERGVPLEVAASTRDGHLEDDSYLADSACVQLIVCRSLDWLRASFSKKYMKETLAGIVGVVVIGSLFLATHSSNWQVKEIGFMAALIGCVLIAGYLICRLVKELERRDDYWNAPHLHCWCSYVCSGFKAILFER